MRPSQTYKICTYTNSELRERNAIQTYRHTHTHTHIHFPHFLILSFLCCDSDYVWFFIRQFFWWFLFLLSENFKVWKNNCESYWVCVWLPNWKPPKPCSKPLSFYTANRVIERKHYNCFKTNIILLMRQKKPSHLFPTYWLSSLFRSQWTFFYSWSFVTGSLQVNTHIYTHTKFNITDCKLLFNEQYYKMHNSIVILRFSLVCAHLFIIVCLAVVHFGMSYHTRTLCLIVVVVIVVVVVVAYSLSHILI